MYENSLQRPKKMRVMEMINNEKKEIIPLTRKEGESFFNKKTVTFAKKNLNTLVIKTMMQLEIIVILQVNIDELHIEYLI